MLRRSPHATYRSFKDLFTHEIKRPVTIVCIKTIHRGSKLRYR
ncbi:Uncharacterised protein [Vibrio cholerae]|nr:Uncharacterised protein [Vibrio cholerae]CSI96556.1 Uncharacterised protein [Vibrio cholerae]